MYSCDSNVSLVLDCVIGGAPAPDRTTAMRHETLTETFSAALDATLVCTSMKRTEFYFLYCIPDETRVNEFDCIIKNTRLGQSEVVVIGVKCRLAVRSVAARCDAVRRDPVGRR